MYSTFVSNAPTHATKGIPSTTRALVTRGSSASPENSDARFDWSEQIHSILDRLAVLSASPDDEAKMEEQLELTSQLVRLDQDFVYTAKTYGKIIIEEAFFPHEQN